MDVTARSVTVEIAGFRLIDGCHLEVIAGEVLGLVGPNGSGKSTLLRTIYRALKPNSGEVQVGGDDVWQLDPRASARRTAVVAQQSFGDFDFTVDEVVAMGRIPHKTALERDNDVDHQVITDALERVGMTGFRDRLFGTLSGGEKQRVLLGRALAQQGEVLVLDEPTNHLDIRAQLDLLDLVRDLRVTTIAALHDLNLAAAYCDRICVIDDGAVVAVGAPAVVLTPTLVADVFGVIAHPSTHPTTRRVHLVFSSIGARPNSSSNQQPSGDMQ